MAGLFAMFCQRTRCRALSVADSLARDALLGGNFDFTARTSLARERWGGGAFPRPMSRLRAGEIEGLRSAYNIGFVDWPKRNLVSRALESCAVRHRGPRLGNYHLVGSITTTWMVGWQTAA